MAKQYRFSTVFTTSQDFKQKTWSQLQAAFPNASYFQNKFITPEGVFFVLASQFNMREPLWTQSEFLGYFNLQVLKGLEDLSYSMGLWLDTTIETTISDPTKRGNIVSSVLTGTSQSFLTSNNTANSKTFGTTNLTNANEEFTKAGDFANVATPIDATSNIANQMKNASTSNNVSQRDDNATNNATSQNNATNQANNSSTSTNFIANIQRLYAMELTSRWTPFLKGFNWLFKSVFSASGTQSSNDNGDYDYQEEIDALFTLVDNLNKKQVLVDQNGNTENLMDADVATIENPLSSFNSIKPSGGADLSKLLSGFGLKITDEDVSGQKYRRVAIDLTEKQLGFFINKPCLVAGTSISLVEDQTAGTITINASGAGPTSGGWVEKNLANYVIQSKDVGKIARFTTQSKGLEFLGILQMYSFAGVTKGMRLADDNQIQIERVFVEHTNTGIWYDDHTYVLEQTEIFSDPSKPQRNLVNKMSRGNSMEITKIEVWE